MFAEEIKKHIGGHGQWKVRLRSAIDTGKSEWTVGVVKPDNLCDFGKWIYSMSAEQKAEEHYEPVRLLHARFHEEAARVLDLALSARSEEANAAAGLQSEFVNVSAELTRTMMKWADAHPED